MTNKYGLKIPMKTQLIYICYLLIKLVIPNMTTGKNDNDNIENLVNLTYINLKYECITNKI